jgi:3-phosphoshikimate 1-carboxyvinyltransferase
VFVSNSGTTVRFLTALAALVPGPVTLEGDEHMARRPIGDLIDALGQLGVRVDCSTGCPPLTVHGGRRAGGLADGPLTVGVDGPLVSRPYVEITRRMATDFGGRIEQNDDEFTITPVGAYRPRTCAIEPDASAASYPFALAAASGGAVTVPGLGTAAVQGDVAFVDVLERAGARVIRAADQLHVEGVRLTGVDVDLRDISDTAMTLAAIAPLAEGPTTIRNVANIRLKETDRLAALIAELRRLGQVVAHGDDWLRIEPRPVEPALVRTYGDHRMAMSFAILGALRPGLTIEDPACVAKTYPGFWEDLARCYEATGAPTPW